MTERVRSRRRCRALIAHGGRGGHVGRIRIVTQALVAQFEDAAGARTSIRTDSLEVGVVCDGRVGRNPGRGQRISGTGWVHSEQIVRVTKRSAKPAEAATAATAATTTRATRPTRPTTTAATSAARHATT